LQAKDFQEGGDLLEEARWEDVWEEAVRRTMEEEGVTGSEQRSSVDSEQVERSFVYTARGAEKALSKSLYEERQRTIARGKAMWDIVVQERELAEKEETQRQKAGKT
jgi:hypothetical protein